MDTRTGELVCYDPQSDFQVPIPDSLIEKAKEVASKGFKLWDEGHPYPELRTWAISQLKAKVLEESESPKATIVVDKRLLKEKKEQSLKVKAYKKKLKKIAEKSRKKNR